MWSCPQVKKKKKNLNPLVMSFGQNGAKKLIIKDQGKKQQHCSGYYYANHN